jgi:hypothetical protein
LAVATGRPQNQLMNLYRILGHLLTIGVFAVISYLLTTSIAVGSIVGVVLAIVSLGATIVFIWLLPKLHEEPSNDEERI